MSQSTRVYPYANCIMQWGNGAEFRRRNLCWTYHKGSVLSSCYLTELHWIYNIDIGLHVTVTSVHETNWFTSYAVCLVSGGDPYLRFSWLTSVPLGKCCVAVLINPRSLTFKFFPIHPSNLMLTSDGIWSQN
jgi:hypothetical protein